MTDERNTPSDGRQPSDPQPAPRELPPIVLDYRRAGDPPVVRTRWIGSAFSLAGGVVASIMVFGCLASSLAGRVTSDFGYGSRMLLAALLLILSIGAVTFGIRALRASFRTTLREDLFGIGALFGISIVMLLTALLCTAR